MTCGKKLRDGTTCRLLKGHIKNQPSLARGDKGCVSFNAPVPGGFKNGPNDRRRK